VSSEPDRTAPPVDADVLSAVVEFADTLAPDFDVVEFLHRLAARCVAVAGMSDAGVMLVDPAGGLRYVASSSEQLSLVELFEVQQSEGPSLDALRTAASVRRNLDADARAGWPRFVDHARACGFASVWAVPMQLRDDRIGILNLFSARPLRAVDDAGLRVAQTLADIATIGILQERARSESLVVTSQLQAALDSRIVIEQAKGIVAERNGIPIDTAFAQLRGYARRHNELLGRVAHDVIEGTLPANRLVEG
jgi:GAF domain-containing protein